EPDHGTVELALGPTARALDARPPGQLVERGQGKEAGEAVVAAVPPRERPAGPDAGRVGGEGAEQAIDVVDHSRFGGARVLVGGNETGAGGLDHRVLVVAEEQRHQPNPSPHRRLLCAGGSMTPFSARKSEGEAVFFTLSGR